MARFGSGSSSSLSLLAGGGGADLVFENATAAAAFFHAVADPDAPSRRVRSSRYREPAPYKIGGSDSDDDGDGPGSMNLSDDQASSASFGGYGTGPFQSTGAGAGGTGQRVPGTWKQRPVILERETESKAPKPLSGITSPFSLPLAGQAAAVTPAPSRAGIGKRGRGDESAAETDKKVRLTTKMIEEAKWVIAQMDQFKQGHDELMQQVGKFRAQAHIDDQTAKEIPDPHKFRFQQTTKFYNLVAQGMETILLKTWNDVYLWDTMKGDLSRIFLEADVIEPLELSATQAEKVAKAEVAAATNQKLFSTTTRALVLARGEVEALTAQVAAKDLEIKELTAAKDTAEREKKIAEDAKNQMALELQRLQDSMLVPISSAIPALAPAPALVVDEKAESSRLAQAKLAITAALEAEFKAQNSALIAENAGLKAREAELVLENNQLKEQAAKASISELANLAEVERLRTVRDERSIQDRKEHSDLQLQLTRQITDLQGKLDKLGEDKDKEITELKRRHTAAKEKLKADHAIAMANVQKTVLRPEDEGKRVIAAEAIVGERHAGELKIRDTKISGLEKQLKELKTEAKTAAEGKDLTIKGLRAQIETHGSELRAAKETAARDAATKATSAAEEKADLARQQQITTAQLALGIVEKARDDLKSANAELKRTYDADIKSKDATIEGLRKKRKEADTAALKAEEAKLTTLQAEMTTLKITHAGEISSLNTQLAKIKGERKGIETKLGDAEKKVADLDKKFNDLDAQVKGYPADLDLKVNQAKVAERNAVVKEYLKEIGKYDKKVSDLEIALATKDGELKSAVSIGLTVEGQLKSQRAEVARLNGLLTTGESELVAANTKAREAERSRDALSRLLEDAKQDRESDGEKHKQTLAKLVAKHAEESSSWTSSLPTPTLPPPRPILPALPPPPPLPPSESPAELELRDLKPRLQKAELDARQQRERGNRLEDERDAANSRHLSVARDMTTITADRDRYKTQTEEQAAKLAKAIADATSANLAAQDKEGPTTRELGEVRAQLVTKNRELEDLEERHGRVQADYKLADEERQKLKRKAAQARPAPAPVRDSRASDLEVQVKQLEEEIAQLKTDRDTSAASRDDTKRDLDGAKARLVKLLETEEKAKKAKEDLRKQLRDRDAEAARLNAAAEAQTKEIEDLARRLREADDVIVQLRARIMDVETKLQQEIDQGKANYQRFMSKFRVQPASSSAAAVAIASLPPPRLTPAPVVSAFASYQPPRISSLSSPPPPTDDLASLSQDELSMLVWFNAALIDVAWGSGIVDALVIVDPDGLTMQWRKRDLLSTYALLLAKQYQPTPVFTAIETKVLSVCNTGSTLYKVRRLGSALPWGTDPTIVATILQGVLTAIDATVGRVRESMRLKKAARASLSSSGVPIPWWNPKPLSDTHPLVDFSGILYFPSMKPLDQLSLIIRHQGADQQFADARLQAATRDALAIHVQGSRL